MAYFRNHRSHHEVTNYFSNTLYEFLLEGIRCGAESQLPRMGHTFAYFPFGAISSVTQMMPYNENYSAQMRARLMIVFIARCIVVSEAYS